MAWTLEQIHQLGLEALRERLGRAGMIRFLQQFDAGHGDYARERHEWVDHVTLGQIRKLAGPQAGRRRRRGR